MDINDELNDLQKQKQVQIKNAQKYNYDEYKKIITNRLRRINGELFILSHELAQGFTQDKIENLQKLIRDFEQKEIENLHEQLKDLFFG